MAAQGFLGTDEAALGETFLSRGRVVVPAEDHEALERVRAHVVAAAAEHLGCELPDDPSRFLNHVHAQLDVDDLNDLRLHVIRTLHGAPWVRPALFRIARRSLESLCGSELAMQRRPNLSVQLPGDTSSLLPIHTDDWAGDSPYEVVLWLPLVDCFRTKSMYLVPPPADRAVRERFDAFEHGSAADLYDAVADDAEALDVPYGHALLFTPSLLHGNRVNEEAETRWSMNVRFKGLFTPYGDKALGSFFEPITLRPASRVGLDHFDPEGFDDATRSPRLHR